MALVPFPSQAPIPLPDADLDPDRDDVLESEEAGGKMSFLEHLDELRRRIIYAVIALAVGFFVCCFFISQIFDFIMRPMQQLLPPGGTLVYTDPVGSVRPLHQDCRDRWAAARPRRRSSRSSGCSSRRGCTRTRRSGRYPFVAMSTFFFVLGAAFAHYVVFPLTWRFFVGFTTDILTFMPRIEPSFSLYLRLVLAFGIVFQLPTLVLFLARMGVLTARFMIKHFKYAVLGIIIISAVITPDGGGVSLFAMYGPADHPLRLQHRPRVGLRKKAAAL